MVTKGLVQLTGEDTELQRGNKGTQQIAGGGWARGQPGPRATLKTPPERAAEACSSSRMVSALRRQHPALASTHTSACAAAASRKARSYVLPNISELPRNTRPPALKLKPPRPVHHFRLLSSFRHQADVAPTSTPPSRAVRVPRGPKRLSCARPASRSACARKDGGLL